MHINFRCGKRLDITGPECGSNTFNYTIDRSVDCSRSDAIVCSQHETSISTNEFDTCDLKQVQNNCGNCRFCTTTQIKIGTNDRNNANKKGQMKDHRVQFMAPMAQLESLTDTIIQSENNEDVAIAETRGLNLCCCSRRTSEPFITNFTDGNKQLLFAETPKSNDKTMQGIVTASTTATAIATQYVGDNVHKDPTETKKSRIHRFLERTTKKHDKSRTLGPELGNDVDSETSNDLEENKSVKTSRRKDILRLLKTLDGEE